MSDSMMEVSTAPPCLMTIFGATGDLTKRLLLPSLYNLAAHKFLPENFRLMGVAVETWDDEAFRKHIAETLPQFWGSDADPAVIEWLVSRAHYRQANFDEPATMLSWAVAMPVYLGSCHLRCTWAATNVPSMEPFASGNSLRLGRRAGRPFVVEGGRS